MDDDLKTIELARDDGDDSSVLWLRLHQDGAISIDGQDTGPLVERFWGHDDYEYIVTVPAAAVPALAFELLRERFTGNFSAVSELRDFCRQHSITSKFGAGFKGKAQLSDLPRLQRSAQPRLSKSSNGAVADKKIFSIYC